MYFRKRYDLKGKNYGLRVALLGGIVERRDPQWSMLPLLPASWDTGQSTLTKTVPLHEEEEEEEKEHGAKPPTAHVVFGVYIRTELHEPGGGLGVALPSGLVQRRPSLMDHSILTDTVPLHALDGRW